MVSEALIVNQKKNTGNGRVLTAKEKLQQEQDAIADDIITEVLAEEEEKAVVGDIIKCKCSLATKFVGDGCQKCNMKYALGLYPSPSEIRESMESAGFTEEQSIVVSEEIVNPLVSYIYTLNEKIDELLLFISNSNTINY